MARILVVEDEEAVRDFCRRALELDNHMTVGAADGGEGLDVLQMEAGAIDLLLTDIRMPVMDGIALALAAARDFPKMPILLMTGYADQRERARNLESLVRDVLVKPFTLAHLREIVGKALKKD
ncbi:response regulator [Terrarubrum flagellatum]|uniref:response regulator n=1 Tax=Terrirubrum flagellatum TaxID=2895980 RepID=UPI0031450C22